jgi:hypothetical protein
VGKKHRSGRRALGARIAEQIRRNKARIALNRATIDHAREILESDREVSVAEKPKKRPRDPALS